MSEPRTQAGRDLLEGLHNHAGHDHLCEWSPLPGILAIEAEALPSVEELARALHLAWHHRDGTCSGDPDLAAAILAALRDKP